MEKYIFAFQKELLELFLLLNHFFSFWHPYIYATLYFNLMKEF